MTVPLWAWAGAIAVLALLIAADLMLTKDTGGWRAAAVPNALWIMAALAICWRKPSA